MSRILNCIGRVVVRLSIPTQTCLLMVSSVTTLGLLVASSAIAQELPTEAPEERASHHQELAEIPFSEDQLAEQPAGEELDVSIAKESLRLTPLFRVGANTESGGTPASLTAFDGFFPLRQSPGHNVTFMDIRLNFDFEEDNSLGGTLLFGHRSYSSDRERVLGGYLSLDVRDTGEAVFPQVGLGFERLGNRWDIRANGYIPVGDTRQRVDRDVFSASQSTSTLGDMAFNGNQLSSTLTTTTTDVFRQVDKFEAALGGFDVEAGTRLARWNEHGELRLYGGVYYLGGHDVSAVGGRGRIEITPVESVRLMAGVQGDPVFDVRGFFGVSFLFPTPEPLQRDVDPDEREAAIAALGETVTRLADPVARNFNVVVDEQQEVEARTTTTVTTEEVPLVNPATGEAWRFTHVALGGSSDGTFEDPFGSLQEGLDAAVGDGNDVVYVALADDTPLDPFTIPDNVRVLSTGPEQVLEGTMAGTSIASVVLPGSNDGNFPDVTDSVTVGSNTKLSGFDITGVTDSAAIVPAGLTGMVEISDNTLTSEVDDGIEIGEITGDLDLLIARNTISEVADSGIFVDGVSGGSSQIRIEDTTIQTAGNAGIEIDEITGELDLQIVRNIINESNGSGIRFEAITDDSTVEIDISDNVISDNIQDGINLGSFFEGNVIAGNAIVNARINRNEITGNGRTGLIVRREDESVLDLAISDNLITDNDFEGIHIDSYAPGTTVEVLDLTISDNIIEGNANNGVTIHGTAINTLTILDNTFRENGDRGLQIEDFSPLVSTCLLLDGNIGSGNGFADFSLENTSGSVFEIVDLGSITVNNSGTFIPIPSDPPFTDAVDCSSS